MDEGGRLDGGKKCNLLVIINTFCKEFHRAQLNTILNKPMIGDCKWGHVQMSPEDLWFINTLSLLYNATKDHI